MTETAVGIATQFVPAGIENIDGTWMLRGSIVLVPVAGSGQSACGTSVDITNWPAEIERLLTDGGTTAVDRLAIAVAPVHDTGSRPVPPTSVANWIPAEQAFLREHAESQRQTARDARRKQNVALNGLWQRLMTSSGVSWADVLSVLGAGSGPSSVDKISTPDTAGQQIPDILSTGRAEMGLLLSLERGRSVLERIRDPQTGRAAEALRTREKRTTAERRASVPWLDPFPGRIHVADATATATDAPLPASKPQTPDEVQRLGRHQAARSLNRQLEPERARTAKQAGVRRAYDKAASTGAVDAALKALAVRKPSCSAPGENASCVAGPDKAGIEAALDRTRRLHRAATNPTEGHYDPGRTIAKKPAALTGSDAARARFFGLQSQPLLARLFNLVIDVVVPLPKAAVQESGAAHPANITATIGKAKPYPETVFGQDLTQARYLFVTARIGQDCGARIAWTVTKIRLPTDVEGGEPVAWTSAEPPSSNPAEHFWACTREELDARAIGWSQSQILDAAIASQVDGLLDLGANRLDAGICNPRFDILTLDVARASDLDIEADAKADASEAGTTAVRTIASGGLLLVDRWRQYHAVTQAVGTLERKAAGSSVPFVVDAEDLTVGLKLDVGLEAGAGGAAGTTWRSLVERTITFAEPGGFDFQAAIETIVPRARARRDLLSALLTLPSRLRQNDVVESATSDGSQKTTMTAYVEEIVASWNGAPLGVDLHGSERLSTFKDPGSLVGTGLLELSQTYALPTTGERPPRLRFGWPYRLGVRVQLAGGVVQSIERAREFYEQAYDHRLSLPRSTPETLGRRALRHERIEAPIVSTPAAILSRPVRGPQETATELVVRTIEKTGVLNGAEAADPATTHRVLLPPRVSLDFADRHDAFRGAKSETYFDGERACVRPIGGLQNINFDQHARGGFPIWSKQETSLGRRYPDGPSFPEPTGDAIFEPRQPDAKSDQRKNAYYPDPAADFMVFQLRNRDGAPVAGQPLVVPVRTAGIAFPDVTPIVVDVVRAASKVRTLPSHERILGIDVGIGAKLLRGREGLTTSPPPVYLDDKEMIPRTIAQGLVPATRVEVRLEPGESFDLDVWCVPSAETLLTWFDLVESASLVASAYNMNGAVCRGGKDFAENLKAFLGPSAVGNPLQGTLLAKSVEEIDQALHGAESVSQCGAGQLALPPGDALRCTATLIFDASLAQVIPELAARFTFRVTHAIDKPVEAPSFAVPPAQAPLPPRNALTLLRVDQTRRSTILGETGDDLLRDVRNWTLKSTTAESTDVVLGGFIALDRATTGFVEVRASGPGLLSGQFDDPSRGRSEDDRARGIWPDDLMEDGRTVQPRKPLHVFGFNVTPGGSVTLMAEEGTLLRLEEIEPVPTLDEQFGRFSSDGKGDARAQLTAPWPVLDLLWHQRRCNPLKAAAVYPDKIADTRARILTLNIVAGSSTSQLIQDLGGIPLGPKEQVRRSRASIRIALPSTKAPARVEPITLLPAFIMTPANAGADEFATIRSVRLRLRVRRPWFSSGAGERLGVVLWPPEFFDDRVQPDANAVRRDYDVDDGSDLMNMAELSDLDLGPGGAFISRWGGDPIKAGPKPSGWLLPPGAFRDVPADAVGPYPRKDRRRDWTPLSEGVDDPDIVYVPRASMPLPVDPEKPSSGPQRLDVALLACRPRFDIDQEHWYFDLNIDPSIVPEPFVRLGLVRYQANAPSDLRVSEPVVEWAQLLPERTATAKVSGRWITVTVKGPGSPLPSRAGDAATVRQDKARADLRDGPRMKVVVYRRSADGIEAVARRAPPHAGEPARRDRITLLTPPDEVSVPSGHANGDRAEEALSPTAAGSSGLLWETAFELDEDPRQPGEDGATYAVVVTEVEVMRPATYRQEPFDQSRAETDDRMVESGPRFAARIEIPRRDMAPPRPRDAHQQPSPVLAVQKEVV